MNIERILKDIDGTEGIRLKEANFGMGNENRLKLELMDTLDIPKWKYFAKVIQGKIPEIMVSENGMEFTFVFPNFESNLEYAMTSFCIQFEKKYFLIEEPPVNNLTIIAKITNLCNLDCVYCYDRPFREKLGHNKTLPLSKLDRLLDMATKYAKHVTLLFHGGEPTVAGLSYYKQFSEEIMPKYTYCDLRVDIQTNGTLLNDDWFKYFNDFNDKHGIVFGVGSSYNATEENLRHSNADNPLIVGEGGIDKVLSNIYLGKKYGYNIGVIDVLTKLNHKNVIKIYEYYKKIDVKACFNIVHKAGAASDPAILFETKEDITQYKKTVTEYFSYWLKDQDERCYPDRYASEYIGILLNCEAPCCEFSYDCSGRWVSINSNGDMYSCDRALPNKYRFGNVMEFNTIGDIFLKSEGFKTFKKERMEKLEKVCSFCNYYPFCKGGCPMKDIDLNCNASIPNGNACMLFRAGLEAAYIALYDASIDTCNKYVRDFFINQCLFFPKEIPALIKYLGAEDLYPKGLDYDQEPRLFNDEFTVWDRLSQTYREVSSEDCPISFGDISNEREDNRFEKVKEAMKAYAGKLSARLEDISKGEN